MIYYDYFMVDYNYCNIIVIIALLITIVVLQL